MKQKLLRNPHPGIILTEEFLEPMQISVYKLAQDLQIPQSRLSEITKGRRSVTADTAIRLGRYFGLPAQFWLGLQMIMILWNRNERKFVFIKTLYR